MSGYIRRTVSSQDLITGLRKRIKIDNKIDYDGIRTIFERHYDLVNITPFKWMENRVYIKALLTKKVYNRIGMQKDDRLIIPTFNA